MSTFSATLRSRLVLGCGLCSALGIVAAGCVAPRGGRAAQDVGWTFDDQPLNHPPKHWRIAATNPTAALATWKVIAAPDTPSGRVLALTETHNYDGTFNLAIAEKAQLQDLELKVKVMAVAGKEDQGGGPIWRCQDENNYYIARFNPLESNFRVYVVADGKRRQLDSIKLDLADGKWYEVRVSMRGDAITCYLDGVELLHATDATIPRSGHVGLWTKADAVTSFDEFACTALQR